MASSLDRSYGVLESSHMIATMLYVADHDGCRKIDVYNDISHNSTMPKKIDMLEDAGLIVQTEVNRGIIITITDKGRAVAEKLRGIKGIMEGTAADVERSRSTLVGPCVRSDRTCDRSTTVICASWRYRRTETRSWSRSR